MRGREYGSKKGPGVRFGGSESLPESGASSFRASGYGWNPSGGSSNSPWNVSDLGGSAGRQPIFILNPGQSTNTQNDTDQPSIKELMDLLTDDSRQMLRRYDDVVQGLSLGAVSTEKTVHGPDGTDVTSTTTLPTATVQHTITEALANDHAERLTQEGKGKGKRSLFSRRKPMTEEQRAGFRKDAANAFQLKQLLDKQSGADQ
jgi:hypothetical protein